MGEKEEDKEKKTPRTVGIYKATVFQKKKNFWKEAISL